MLLFMVSTLTASIDKVEQEAQTVTATYVGSQNGEFYFTKGETKMVFQSIDYKVAETVNLADEALKGQIFEVTYTSEIEEDEGGEDVEVNTIIKLVPSK